MDATTPLPEAASVTEPMSGHESPPAPSSPPPVNVTRLLAEAATKSDVLWIRLPDGTTHPAWFVWHEDDDPRGAGPSAYVISGPGEQPLPWLPAKVDLILRSKDTGARILTIPAAVVEVTPASPDWEAACAVLRPARLNLIGTPEEVDARWRAGCTVHVLTPQGSPSEQPGNYSQASGAEPVAPSRARTLGWRPWHWRGRPASRRGTR